MSKTMKFSVYDNNKPATSASVGFPELMGEGWGTYTFDRFSDAFEYAKKWLGSWDVLPALGSSESVGLEAACLTKGKVSWTYRPGFDDMSTSDVIEIRKED